TIGYRYRAHHPRVSGVPSVRIFMAMTISTFRMQWKSIVPRIVADFLCIQASILFALGVVVVYYSSRGPSASVVGGDLLRYYWRHFLPISPLFCGSLYYCGIYDVVRHYRVRQKVLMIWRACALATAVTLTVNYFLFRTDILARSVTVVFT